MSDGANEDELAAQALSLHVRGAQLLQMDRSRISAALHATVRDLAEPTLPDALALRSALEKETGLSRAMIDWGMDQVSLSFSEEGLSRLCAQYETSDFVRAVPPRLIAIVLPDNVFTASLRSIALCLLAKSPVLIKTPQQRGALVFAFVKRLQEVDAEVADHVKAVAFGRGDAHDAASLWAHADVVSAYGDDHTMSTLRHNVPGAVRLVEHGHGISAAYIPATAIADDLQVNAVAQRLALDIAAYDQLGCLSPQFAFVERGGVVDHVAFAEALSSALNRVAELLPRGRVPADAAAQLVQWRGVAAARGTLFASAGHACAAEAGELRFGPGYRHVSVYPCGDEGELWRRLVGLGAHLKCMGVAGSRADRLSLAAHLPAGLSPRMCALGTMQSPPLDAYFDGQSPLYGILNYTQVS